MWHSALARSLEGDPNIGGRSTVQLMEPSTSDVVYFFKLVLMVGSITILIFTTVYFDFKVANAFSLFSCGLLGFGVCSSAMCLLFSI